MTAEAPAICFSVPGRPVPFARAASNGARRFTPPRQRAYADAVKALATVAMRGAKPFVGPVEMSVAAIYRRPWRGSPIGEWKVTVPDADNLAKLCADALKGIAWGDDAQVARLVVEKFYGPSDGLNVMIRALPARA